jgi:hypothetical protein
VLYRKLQKTATDFALAGVYVSFVKPAASEAEEREATAAQSPRSAAEPSDFFTKKEALSFAVSSSCADMLSKTPPRPTGQ